MNWRASLLLPIVEDLAIFLSNEGLADKPLQTLRGGINNLVYSIEGKKNKLIVKHYPKNRQTSLNKMKAEVQLLALAGELCPNFVPLVISFDFSLQCVLMEFVSGSTFTSGSGPNEEDIHHALEFFALLNHNKVVAQKYVSVDAAEGFLCISEHIGALEARLDRMSVGHLPNRLVSIASSTFDDLTSSFHLLTKKYRDISGSEENEIERSHLIVSPSDFGFHNALKTSSGCKFIDFEFAGWDDPAKASCDFVLQPECTPKCDEYALLNTLKLGNKYPEFERRVDLLFPVLRLKWAFLILSFYDEERLEQICEIMPCLDIDEYLQQKLVVVEKYLE